MPKKAATVSLKPMRAEVLPLSQVKQLPRNAKAHDVDAIQESMEEFGFMQRIVINDRTGHLLSGHGRIDTLNKLHTEGHEPPVGIEDGTNGWLVPVDFVDVPEEREEAAAMALNKVQEIGGWEDETYRDVVKALTESNQLAGTGISAEEVAKALETPHLKEHEIDQPPPTMVWALIGVPMELYPQVTGHIEAIAQVPECIVEVSGGHH